MTVFPTVFDGHIRVTQVEEFQIVVTDAAKPFGVHTPRTIPFAYRDKLQAELCLLEHHCTSYGGYTMVHANCSDAQEEFRQDPDVCRPFTPQQVHHL